jgi:hypothetical protein
MLTAECRDSLRPEETEGKLLSVAGIGKIDFLIGVHRVGHSRSPEAQGTQDSGPAFWITMFALCAGGQSIPSENVPNLATIDGEEFWSASCSAFVRLWPSVWWLAADFGVPKCASV